jgi:hypothetical protein
MTNDDMRLVREYASRQSESAFAALVSSHTKPLERLSGIPPAEHPAKAGC